MTSAYRPAHPSRAPSNTGNPAVVAFTDQTGGFASPPCDEFALHLGGKIRVNTLLQSTVQESRQSDRPTSRRERRGSRPAATLRDEDVAPSTWRNLRGVRDRRPGYPCQNSTFAPAVTFFAYGSGKHLSSAWERPPRSLNIGAP